MSFNTGLSGLNAASADLDVISNNIANANTTGFKTSSAHFADVYASSASGSSTAIGMGVKLASVTQDFSDGNYISTGSKYDYAINGGGFFTLRSNGSLLYSRAGHFEVNQRTGELQNDFGAKLVGYMPDYSVDPNGSVGSLIGNIVIDATEAPPKQTNNVKMGLNLNAADTPKTTNFMAGFTPSNPPVPGSYNYTTQQVVFDTLGNQHTMAFYYVKEATGSQWQVFVGMDGTDVTPSASSGSPRPFTVVFDSAGNYIPHNPTLPPTVTSPASVTGIASPLGSTGSLTPLSSGDLIINGISVGASASDGISSAQADSSAAAIQAAINAASIPGLTCSVVPATVQLGVYIPPTPASTPFAAGSLVINGVDLAGIDSGSGNGVFATAADLAAAISSIPGLTGSAVGNNISIVANDGRNVQIETNGLGPVGASLSNLNLGAVGDYVQRGTVNITGIGAGSLIVGGNASLNAGLATGTYFAEADYNASDNIVINNWNPGTGAALQNIAVDLSSITQSAGGYTNNGMTQDGYAAGQLSDISTDSDGVVSAVFTNGQKKILGQILLTRFNNIDGLQPVGNSMWAESNESGTPIHGAAFGNGFGSIMQQQLEQSNVDITAQLVDLIIAQRNFQANAQTIKTSDAITQTIMNIQ